MRLMILMMISLSKEYPKSYLRYASEPNKNPALSGVFIYMNIDNELVILLLNINQVCLHRSVFSEAFGKRYFHQAAK